LAWIVSRELTRKNTVYEQAQNNRHRKRQKQYVKRNEKCMQQLKAQKQPGVNVHKIKQGECRMQGSFGVHLRKGKSTIPVTEVTVDERGGVWQIREPGYACSQQILQSG